MYGMTVEENNCNSIICLYHGFFYQYKMEDYDLMKKYYLQAIECNNSNAMTLLGKYYKNKEKNYDLMKKYYLMAINCNNENAIYGLAKYYEYNEINYDLMKKYYLWQSKINIILLS